MRVLTGFHAIEEGLRAIEGKPSGIHIKYAKAGPRVKKILAQAQDLSIPCTQTTDQELDSLSAHLSETARDHRGIVMILANEEALKTPDFDEYLALLSKKERAVVLVLDSITDPHNVGAIIRSADQFAIDLVILPERRGATDFGIISRTSAGASSWVPLVITVNLTRAIDQLKEAGFWVYGADAGGQKLAETLFADKSLIIMGSEGTGMGRLIRERCDHIVSIPTSGKLDSLNVSVAAGILLYEIRRQIPSQG